MTLKYIDIVKKDIKYKEPIIDDIEDEIQDNISTKKSKRNNKQINYNYDLWEYTYFPYLFDMYSLIYDSWDDKEMYNFCVFIYNVSSQKISLYLNEMTKEQEDIYFQYMIKRNSFIL